MFGSETSVNSRARTDNTLPCMYGACLRRLTNWACAARAMYPNIAIFASKVDFKSAYRRCHLNPSTVLQSCTQVEINKDDKLLIMFLRLTFGGKLCPSEWSALAEPIWDLSTALLHNERWDPTTLASPSQSLVPPPVRNRDSSRPLGVGRELAVEIPINPRGTHNLYLDNIVGLTLDMPGSKNLDRLAGAHLLAIAATARQATMRDRSQENRWKLETSWWRKQRQRRSS